MYKQAEEERQHAMDMAQFVLHRGGEVVLTAIDAVKTDWADAKEVFVDTLAHEQNVEEERSLQDILDSFAHLSSHAVAHIDSQLAKRQ